MTGDRVRLTHLLRSPAPRLDRRDHRTAKLKWGRGVPHTGAAIGKKPCRRTALESGWGRLTEVLTVLAGPFGTLDKRIPGELPENTTPTRVGTCPHCGYPSLGSGLCAYCRPHQAR